jgi:hypothetical protein
MQVWAEEISYPNHGLQGYLIKLERQIDPSKNFKKEARHANTSRVHKVPEKVEFGPISERLPQVDKVYIPNNDNLSNRLFMFNFDMNSKSYKGNKMFFKEKNIYN